MRAGGPHFLAQVSSSERGHNHSASDSQGFAMSKLGNLCKAPGILHGTGHIFRKWQPYYYLALFSSLIKHTFSLPAY